MPISRRALLMGLAAPNTIRAGAATANISPALGTSLAGGMTDRKCTDVHDELLVRCAALESGSTRMLLATIDSCMVPREVLDKVRARISRENAVDPACVLLSSTHTHSAPPAMHLFQSLPDVKYIQMLETRLVDAARMAFTRMRPARLGSGLGAEPALVNNRRYFMRAGAVPSDPFGRKNDRVLMNPNLQSPDLLQPAGPIDPAHPVMAAVGMDGRPIWVYASYALHYAGNNPGTHASADYFGAWTRRVEAFAGGECVALLANGCSGNINAIVYARQYPSRGDYAFIDRVGGVLALETVRVLKTMEFVDTVALSGKMADVEVGVRRPSEEELATAVKLVGETPGNEFKDRAQIYARETVFMSRYTASRRVPVQALRIGDVGIGTFPGETFVELGWR
jgi:neutral ceramidase